jgi:isochorismate hydrolase
MNKVIVYLLMQIVTISCYGQDSLAFFLPKVEWKIIDSTLMDEDIPSMSLDFIIYSKSNSSFYLCKSGFNMMFMDSTVSLAIEGVNVYLVKRNSNSKRTMLKLIWNESVLKKPKKRIRIDSWTFEGNIVVLDNVEYSRFPEQNVVFNRPVKILRVK